MSTTSSALVNASKYARSRTSSPLRGTRSRCSGSGSWASHSARCRLGGARRIDTVANRLGLDVQARIDQRLCDEIRRRANSVEVLVELRDVLVCMRVSSQAKCSRLMPPGASATRRGYSGSRRPGMAPRRSARRASSPRGDWQDPPGAACSHRAPRWRGSRPNSGCDPTPEKAPIDSRQAVARLERPLDLHLERT